MKIIQKGDFHYKIENDKAEIFKYDGDKKRLVIPSTINGVFITSLGENLFRKKSVTNVVLPQKLEIIGTGAFSETNLTDINFPESLLCIGDMAFCDTKLRDIKLPKTLKSIGGEYGCGAFANTLIKEFIIPDSVEEFNFQTFSADQGVGFDGNISAIEHIYIGKNVKPRWFGGRIFMHSVFKGCRKLANIEVHPENIYFTCVDNVLFDKEMKILYKYPPQKMEKVYTIPEDVETVNDFAFEYAQLERVIVCEGLKSIDDGAFRESRLNEINIPESVEYINIGYYVDRGEIFIPSYPKDVKFLVSGGNTHYAVVNGTLKYIKEPNADAGIPSTQANDAKETYTCGDYTYRITENHGAKITQYNGKPLLRIEIPETLDRYPVAEINAGFHNCSWRSPFTHPYCPDIFCLPGTIENFDARIFEHDICNLWRVEIDESNPHYIVVDDVVYSKDLSELVFYPPCREGEFFKTPDSVVIISDCAFCRTRHLKTLVISKSVKDIGKIINDKYNVNIKKTLPCSIETIVLENSIELAWRIMGVEYTKAVYIPSCVTEFCKIYPARLSMQPKIYCQKDTAAECFAIKYGLDYEIIDKYPEY